MRSHSFPLEFSSFSMRSAKLGQGTNSNFIAMPVLAVKSLESSTNALAGSHAAQQRVSCLVCAWAEVAKASIADNARVPARATSVFITTPPPGCDSHAANGPAADPHAGRHGPTRFMKHV